MNRYFVLFGFMLLFVGIVFAVPQINSIDYIQPAYVSQPTTINIALDTNGQSGEILLLEQGTQIHSIQFTPANNTLQTTYTWNTSGNKEINFKMKIGIDIVHELNQTIEIKKGIDFKINSITSNPEVVYPNTPITFTLNVQNIGDEQYVGNIIIEVMADANILCNSFVNSLDKNEIKDISCVWNSPAIIEKTYNIVGWINRPASTNYIPENDHTNNTKVYKTLTAPLPDLSVKSVKFPETIRRTVVNNIDVIIQNTGNAQADMVEVEVYLKYGTENKEKIRSHTIPVIDKESEASFGITEIFNRAGEYTLEFLVDPENKVEETNVTNNRYVVKFTVEEFDIDKIMQEFEKLRGEVIIEKAKTEACLTKNNQLNQDFLLKDNELKNCQSNLNICNTNNSTTIHNWKKEYDSNQEAMIEIMRNENSRLASEKANLERTKDAEIQGTIDEKNQWSGLVVIALIAFVCWLGYNEYLKRRPRKGVNINE
jgi:subtilase family serine protease